MQAFNLIMSIVTIIIYVFTLQWINRLETTKCKCSEDFKRDFIKYYIYIYFANIAFMIFASLAFFILGLSGTSAKKLFASSAFIAFIQICVSILSIINIIFSIMYIYNLKKTECKCSEGMEREVYYIWNIIGAAMIGMSFLMLLFGFINIRAFQRKLGR